MRVSEFILKKLKTDKKFRLGTALALEIGERQVQYLVDANSDNLTKMAAVNFYRGMGLTDEQIFEPNKLSESA